MADPEDIDETKRIGDAIVDLLNSARHPATALTALQFVVAQTLHAYRVPPRMFLERVKAAMHSGRIHGRPS